MYALLLLLLLLLVVVIGTALLCCCCGGAAVVSSNARKQKNGDAEQGIGGGGGVAVVQAPQSAPVIAAPTHVAAQPTPTFETAKDARQHATAIGVPAHLIEEARDADDPKTALTALIVQHANGGAP